RTCRQLPLQLLVSGTFLRHQLQVGLVDRQLLLKFLAAGTLLHQVGFGSFGQFLGIRIRPWPAFLSRGSSLSFRNTGRRQGISTS
ncbi:MAG TPA: hypothetical protein VH499_17935, partial [Reyranella sp.]